MKVKATLYYMAALLLWAIMRSLIVRPIPQLSSIQEMLEVYSFMIKNFGHQMLVFHYIPTKR